MSSHGRGRLVPILVLLAACGGSSPSTLEPRAKEAQRLADLWWLLAGLGVAVYLVVTALVVVALLRRRHGPSPERPGEHPESGRRDTRFIVLGGLVVPTLILAIVGAVTVTTTNALRPPAGVIHIDVRAERWWWRLTYPDDGVETANEIHVPVGRAVDLRMTSDNVIHSVWVPQLNGKTDVVPGQVNHLSFTADRTGTYRGQCAEFCGIAHTRMALLVIVQSPEDYQRWLQENRAPATTPAAGPAQDGEALLTSIACAGCHTVSGTEAVGTLGPDLTHFGGRQTIAAVTLPNTEEDLRRWLEDTQGVKPGALMPQIDLTDDQVEELVAYLQGLR